MQFHELLPLSLLLTVFLTQTTGQWHAACLAVHATEGLLTAKCQSDPKQFEFHPKKKTVKILELRRSIGKKCLSSKILELRQSPSSKKNVQVPECPEEKMPKFQFHPPKKNCLSSKILELRRSIEKNV